MLKPSNGVQVHFHIYIFYPSPHLRFGSVQFRHLIHYDHRCRIPYYVPITVQSCREVPLRTFPEGRQANAKTLIKPPFAVLAARHAVLGFFQVTSRLSLGFNKGAVGGWIIALHGSSRPQLHADHQLSHIYSATAHALYLFYCDVSFQQQESSAVLPTPDRQRPDRRSTYLPTIADYRVGLRVSLRSADQDQKITKLDNRFTKTTARLPPSPFSASSCSCCCTPMTKAYDLRHLVHLTLQNLITDILTAGDFCLSVPD